MMRAGLILVLLATAQAQAAAQPMPRQQNVPADGQAVGVPDSLPVDRPGGASVKLRALDTLNGTVRDIDIQVGATVRFGHLDIKADACRQPPGEAGADAYALLRIQDIREDRPRFAGWMFASSPALSALDHPRYDVWVLSCSNS